MNHKKDPANSAGSFIILASYAFFGGVKAVRSSAGPSYFSIFTSAELAAQPLARRDVGMSEVSTFAPPFLQIPVSLSKSGQPPSWIQTEPCLMPSVTSAPTSTCPRSLYARTRSPVLMPCAFASSVLMEIGSRLAIAYSSRISHS